MPAAKRKPVALRRAEDDIRRLTEQLATANRVNGDLTQEVESKKSLMEGFVNQSNKLTEAVGLLEDVEKIANGFAISRHNMDFTGAAELGANVGYVPEVGRIQDPSPDPMGDYLLDQQRKAVAFEARLAAISALCARTRRLSS